jgi:hypothetical protein
MELLAHFAIILTQQVVSIVIGLIVRRVSRIDVLANWVLANWSAIILSSLFAGWLARRLLKKRLTLGHAFPPAFIFTVGRIGYGLWLGVPFHPVAIVVMLVLYTFVAMVFLGLGSRY